MTVEQLIETLSNLDPDTKVAVLTPNAQMWLDPGHWISGDYVVFLADQTGSQLFEFEIGGRRYLAESMEHAIEQDEDAGFNDEDRDIVFPLDP